MECVFCAIRDARIPAIVVAEAERAFAIMDINPINDGHTLIIPRLHAQTLFEIPEEDWIATNQLAQRVARAIRMSLSPGGLNLLQNSGAAAFQSVPHLHIHLIPRWKDDGKGFNWPLIPGSPARMRRTAEMIRSGL